MNWNVPKLEVLAMMCWVSIEITVTSGIDRRQWQQVKSLKSLTAWQEKGEPGQQTANFGLSGGEQREHRQCTKTRTDRTPLLPDNDNSLIAKQCPLDSSRNASVQPMIHFPTISHHIPTLPHNQISSTWPIITVFGSSTPISIQTFDTGA